MLGDKVTVAQAVTAAVNELDAGKLNDQPLVEASVRETIGVTLKDLGRFADAEVNLRKAVNARRAARLSLPKSARPAEDEAITGDILELAFVV